MNILTLYVYKPKGTPTVISAGTTQEDVTNVRVCVASAGRKARISFMIFLNKSRATSWTFYATFDILIEPFLHPIE